MSGSDPSGMIQDLPPDTRAADGTEQVLPQTAPRSAAHPGVLAVLRDWLDAIVIAIVLATFLRVFMIEIFMIPTGSMTPTLIGGNVARFDYNGDQLADLLFFADHQAPLLFLNNGHRLVGQGPLSFNEQERPSGSWQVVTQNDRILVNKLAYWFHTPRRGDVVVFKVPHEIWDPTKPIYIKRCVGEPGEVLSFDHEGFLFADGRRITQPGFFRTQRYELTLSGANDETDRLPEVSYSPTPSSTARIHRIHVNRGEVFVFGDNTWNSRDSRYWGGVPLNNVKGRAFCRIWPFGQIKSLLEG